MDTVNRLVDELPPYMGGQSLVALKKDLGDLPSVEAVREMLLTHLDALFISVTGDARFIRLLVSLEIDLRTAPIPGLWKRKI